ncbi:hypothetical protein [Pseudomonas sp. GL-R-26]|uniref:hypothetical protein n=1 Tax=Pseudomonas sp. GL-R-26 TaxID=2832392 RepID=UPI001CC13E42|nr:hypothetical protein [Pseudomonas sp. GL-R-26]
MRQHPTQNELEKALGEPVGFDISDVASKIRRNLLLASMVVLVLILGGIEPSSEVSIFGVALKGVTSFKLMVGLALVLCYNLCHYLWYCYELYSEWSVRVTGTKLAFVTGAKLGATGADYPDDPKQSTLYTWWLQEARSMTAYSDLLRRVEKSIEGLNGHVEHLEKVDGTVGGTVSRSIQEVSSSLQQIKHSLASTEDVIANTRIPFSLERFDKRFELLLKSQNARVLLIEVALPIALSLVSIWYLIRFFLQHQS